MVYPSTAAIFWADQGFPSHFSYPQRLLEFVTLLSGDVIHDLLRRGVSDDLCRTRIVLVIPCLVPLLTQLHVGRHDLKLLLLDLLLESA